MIEFSVNGRIAEIVLNAPERMNALGTEDIAALTEAFEEAGRLAEQGDLRVVLLRAEGRAFSAGRNLKGLEPGAGDTGEYLTDSVVPLMRTMAELPVPIVAAAQGAVLGAGLGVLAAADVAYVAEDATFGSPFGALGLILDCGGHWLFNDRMGYQRTMDLILTGEFFSGADAVAAGLFSRAVPAEDLERFAREKAEAVAAGPALAFQASKRVLGEIRAKSLGFWEALEFESDEQISLASSPDYAEGLAAFQEKRRPVFE
ncbi:enoyl-CoA hydratase/isomerase family protein [Falsarthrobacter nasiphocae]|uniref:Enoyl-CoA hydratase/carnithine racemase n=1 Tax=Falsarthrobacter nasiphocae TaxID=189863 RepID=A0AAE3YIK1_9MICC|nr:enoyl-CoA hydratase/isomerase family protein [Falsarthrobacter nasiphocae]MDR6892411.1 enoyl-CoA hydratase/carnithine racemase [Falsarthrobacter nasiphocae]